LFKKNLAKLTALKAGIINMLPLKQAIKKLERLDHTALNGNDNAGKISKRPISRRYSNKRAKRRVPGRKIMKEESHDKIIAEYRKADNNRRLQM
jgi:hypothetical protein